MQAGLPTVIAKQVTEKQPRTLKEVAVAKHVSSRSLGQMAWTKQQVACGSLLLEHVVPSLGALIF